MAIALPGLASGLDSAAIIAATMDVERLPKLSLETKAASASNYVSVLKTLNGKVSDLLTAAQAQTKPDAFSLFTTTSSSPSVTVTAGSAAAAGELDITVTSVAARHSAVTAPMTAWGQNPPVLTFATAAGEVAVTADSDSLDDVVKAVNASDAGVTATKVSAGNGEFRLQFTAKETGAENAFRAQRLFRCCCSHHLDPAGQRCVHHAFCRHGRRADHHLNVEQLQGRHGRGGHHGQRCER